MDNHLVLEIAKKISEGMSYKAVQEVYGFTKEQMQELQVNMVNLTLQMSAHLDAPKQKQLLQSLAPQVQQMIDKDPNMSEHTRDILEQILALTKYED